MHPTPLYEALAAGVIAAILWRLATTWTPPAVFGAYLALSGVSRFLVEFLRINAPALLGLTQPQLWALASVAAGMILILRAWQVDRRRPSVAAAPGAHEPIGATSTV